MYGRRILVAAVMAITAGNVAVVSGPVYAAPGSISGRVFGVSGGSDLCLRLFDGPGGTEIVQTPQVCTDSGGNFEFLAMPDGAYWVELDDQTDTYAALGEPAVVTDGSVSVAYLDATAGPALTGRVVDENGQPARGIVQVDDNICCNSYGLIDETGRYLVRLQESSANVFFDGYGLTDEWYADAPSKASSTPVVIGSGITVVDATLAAPAHVIEGRVTNLIGAGVAGAAVTITSTTNGNDRATTTTDALGNYSIPAPPQSYQIRVDATGYNPQWFNGQQAESLGEVVTITNSDLTANFNLATDDKAVVVGRVRDVGRYGPNINIPGACVTVWDAAGGYVFGPICHDSTAYFRTVAQLSPDTEYRFEAAAIGYVNQSQTRFLQRGIPTELYFDMQPSVETTTVSGSVRDSVGALIPDACIKLFDYFGGSAGPLASQCVDTNGDYEFTGVFAGTYRVEITAAGYVTLNSTKEVSTATTPVDFDFVMTATTPVVVTSITGVVTDGFGAPLAGIEVSAYGSLSNGFATTGADGSYSINSGLTTGTYKISFFDPTYARALEWWDDQASYGAATPLNVLANTAVTGINAVLLSATLSGTVTNDLGQPLAGIYVEAYGMFSNGFAITAPDGTYTIGGLTTDEYRIKFDDPARVYSSEWWNDRSDYGTAEIYSVVAGTNSGGVDAALSRTTVSGTVTNGFGQPLADIYVTAYGTFSNGFAITAADGTYTMSTLGTDSYAISFEDTGSRTIEWWNNKPDFGSADRLAVTRGDAMLLDYVMGGAPDVIAPGIMLNSPAEGAKYTLGQSVAASYSCTDAGGSGVASCIGSAADGAAIDTSTPGPKTFAVNASDVAGNPASASAAYTVYAGNASQQVTPGAIVNTDPGGLGATPDVLVQTSVTVPSGVTGTITVTPEPLGTPPVGFALFGDQIVLNGPTATVAEPYELTFTIDASARGAVAPGDVQVFRNGVAVADCTDLTRAVPDPCVVSRGLVGGDGDSFITARTSQFSKWSIGRVAYAPSGFFAPVDNLPTINIVKAGSAVPIKFSLGGNRGLNVFAAGSPSSSATACGSGPSDDLESTVSAAGSTLTYANASDRYQYVWKTNNAWKGCRELVLHFRDGSVMRARFMFR